MTTRRNMGDTVHIDYTESHFRNRWTYSPSHAVDETADGGAESSCRAMCGAFLHGGSRKRREGDRRPADAVSCQRCRKAIGVDTIKWNRIARFDKYAKQTSPDGRFRIEPGSGHNVFECIDTQTGQRYEHMSREKAQQRAEQILDAEFEAVTS